MGGAEGTRTPDPHAARTGLANAADVRAGQRHIAWLVPRDSPVGTVIHFGVWHGCGTPRRDKIASDLPFPGARPTPLWRRSVTFSHGSELPCDRMSFH
ncbi:hypothetical protein GCM10010199_43780 [Dactylosporangium roseum]